MLRPRNILSAIGAGVLSPVFWYSTALADTPGIGQVQNFLKNFISAIAGLAGIVATAFFVIGGLRYITSSGNPHHLESAKRTIFFAATGLAITIGAFVLSNIVSNLANSSFGG